jgi:hypothetical protein
MLPQINMDMPHERFSISIHALKIPVLLWIYGCKCQQSEHWENKLHRNFDLICPCYPSTLVDCAATPVQVPISRMAQLQPHCQRRIAAFVTCHWLPAPRNGALESQEYDAAHITGQPVLDCLPEVDETFSRDYCGALREGQCPLAAPLLTTHPARCRDRRFV